MRKYCMCKQRMPLGVVQAVQRAESSAKVKRHVDDICLHAQRSVACVPLSLIDLHENEQCCYDMFLNIAGI